MKIKEARLQLHPRYSLFLRVKSREIRAIYRNVNILTILDIVNNFTDCEDIRAALRIVKRCAVRLAVSKAGQL